MPLRRSSNNLFTKLSVTVASHGDFLCRTYPESVNLSHSIRELTDVFKSVSSLLGALSDLKDTYRMITSSSRRLLIAMYLVTPSAYQGNANAETSMLTGIELDLRQGDRSGDIEKHPRKSK